MGKGAGNTQEHMADPRREEPFSSKVKSNPKVTDLAKQRTQTCLHSGREQGQSPTSLKSWTYSPREAGLAYERSGQAELQTWLVTTLCHKRLPVSSRVPLCTINPSIKKLHEYRQKYNELHEPTLTAKITNILHFENIGDRLGVLIGEIIWDFCLFVFVVLGN
jgi:hypothetical protein